MISYKLYYKLTIFINNSVFYYFVYVDLNKMIKMKDLFHYYFLIFN